MTNVMTEEQIRDVLKRARLLVDTNWGVGGRMRNFGPNTQCLLGIVGQAALGEGWRFDGVDEVSPYRFCFEDPRIAPVVDRIAQEVKDEDELQSWLTSNDKNYQIVYTYNDRMLKSRDQVYDLFDRLLESSVPE